MTVVRKVMDIAEAGRRWRTHLQAIGRRKSTRMDYESPRAVTDGRDDRLCLGELLALRWRDGDWLAG